MVTLREEAEQLGISVYELMGKKIIEERVERDEKEWKEFEDTLFNSLNEE